MKVLPYKRKLDRKTDYRKRLSLLKSRLPRFVVRKRNNSLIAQIVNYKEKGDEVVTTSTISHLKKYGWKLHGANTPAAYLTGLHCGIQGKKKGVKKCILDATHTTTRKGSSTYAVVKGLIDAGINLNCAAESFPSEERISGKHIADYAKSLKEETYKKIFSQYAKQGITPDHIQKHVEEMKKKIIAEP